MSAGRWRRAWPAAIGSATALACAGPVSSDARCSLVLQEHRSGKPLVRTPWPERELRVAFVHSVLGTPVEDRYRWQAGAWHLVEERFEGQGYGLPHAAGPGEQLLHEGASSRLLLDRRVMPLVIRPLPAQSMRVILPDGREWRLGALSEQAIELAADDC